MTTLSAQFENELLQPAGGTFQGTNFSFGTAPAPASSPSKIHFMRSHQSNRESKGMAAFNSLIASLESTAEGKAKMQEARQWAGNALFGETVNLASLRMKKGLSQKDLAQACEMDQPHVSRYEQGRCVPSLILAKKMATALGVSLDEFHQAFENGAYHHE